MPKYPNILITLDLDGPGGNVYSIVARVDQALRSEGVNMEDRQRFRNECLCDDYEHALKTVEEWVEVEE